MKRSIFLAGLLIVSATFFGRSISAVELGGRILDADGEIVPARLYIFDSAGAAHFAGSADADGSAIPYDKVNWFQKTSTEQHVTLSAHPWRIDLPPGKYRIVAERGLEYHSAAIDVELADAPCEVDLTLHRWIHLAQRGWYSGDTHVHRTVADLANVQLAEDLNVALPLTSWVTQAYVPPTQGDKNESPVQGELLQQIDDLHVIYTRNTEYELFTANGRQHTMGAFFVLNHQQPLTLGVPPVRQVRQAEPDALIDLDKHNWPWSIAMVPLLDVDLYELSNNHMWRTEFAYTDFGEPAPDYMGVETNDRGLTEQGWIDYTLQTYYALLNCGFRLRPTAGTANGVHPVPLGFSRVYVHQPAGFSYESWIDGLDAGASFVTTGPALLVLFNNRPLDGEPLALSDGNASVTVSGEIASPYPVTRVEILSAGKVVASPKVENVKTESGALVTKFRVVIPTPDSTWLAARCFAAYPGRRIRFAHSAPLHVELKDRPLRPRREEVEYLLSRVEAEKRRSREYLPPQALQEYNEAAAAFAELLDASK